jgi:4-carboxymuconolactone decarboxylase
MTDQPKQLGGGRRMFGAFAPKLAELTDDVLFEDMWDRPELAAHWSGPGCPAAGG